LKLVFELSHSPSFPFLISSLVQVLLVPLLISSPEENHQNVDEDERIEFGGDLGNV
jgi:hypothetical protein